MLILALDTSTDKGSLALVDGERVLAESLLESPGTYLSRMMPGIEALMAATGRSLEELGAVAVSQGPGNFTGLRIGLATAKALAWSLGCPLVAVPTLEAMAAQFPFQPQPVGVLSDAKRQEVFFGLFLLKGEFPEVLQDPVRLAWRDVSARLRPPMLLTGPGLEVYAGALTAEGLSPEILLAPAEMRHPRAATVARLALRRLKEGRTASPRQLAPMYLRPAL